MRLRPRSEPASATRWWVETVAATMIAAYGLVALFAGAASLTRGDTPSGRAIALLVRLNGLVLVCCAVAVLRLNRARLPVAVIGLTLASFQASLDESIFTGSTGFMVDLWPLTMLASLAIAWLMTRTSMSAKPVGRLSTSRLGDPRPCGKPPAFASQSRGCHSKPDDYSSDLREVASAQNRSNQIEVSMLAVVRTSWAKPVQSRWRKRFIASFPLA